jgi:hypothetical protein
VAGRRTSSLASSSPSSTLVQPPERDADGRGVQGAGGEWRREREREGTWGGGGRERENGGLIMTYGLVLLLKFSGRMGGREGRRERRRGGNTFFTRRSVY